MNELIPIQKNGNDLAVSARELYDFLEVKSLFTHWCNRMFSYGFEDGIDFLPFLAESTGGRPSTDFILTIDTAKEISMLQRTEKGKEARQYFIECEKRLNRGIVNASPLALAKLTLEALEQQEQRLLVVEQKVTEVQAKVETINEDYFSLSGYYVLKGKRFDLTNTEAQQKGRELSKKSSLNGYTVDRTYHAKYGSVGTYHKDVLQAVLGF